MKVMIPVSIGELMDRVSILMIKKRNIKDPVKLKYVENELSELEPISIPYRDNYFERLEKINGNLWSVEDLLRKCEEGENFSDVFITLARSVYKLNDQRAEVKRKINKKYNSEIVEVKSYNTGEK